MLIKLSLQLQYQARPNLIEVEIIPQKRSQFMLIKLSL
ncbi:hypothetical protein HZS_6125 [Henneguya salminicola]|nr:hypothetical protein HZS_6125 [Henneguya salminicola]